jgi:hypothetical protein
VTARTPDAPRILDPLRKTTAIDVNAPVAFP